MIYLVGEKQAQIQDNSVYFSSGDATMVCRQLATASSTNTRGSCGPPRFGVFLGGDAQTHSCVTNSCSSFPHTKALHTL